MAEPRLLPSGNWRLQAVVGGHRKSFTSPIKAEVVRWGKTVQAQSRAISIDGYAPPPKGATLGDLIERYVETTEPRGRSRTATLRMLDRKLGKVSLAKLTALTIRDFVDRRVADGAGGVTLAGDLSALSSVLEWGKHARRFDLPVHLARDARASLKHRKLKTRSVERDREPTDDELDRLYALWRANPRQKIDMVTICRFALATGMRQDEICRLQVDDIDAEARTVVIRDRKDPVRKQGNHQTVPLLPDAWAIAQPRLADRAGCFLFDARGTSVSAAFTRACQKLGIVDLHFHDLRHAAAAEFFRQGLQIQEVAVMTGHRTWTQLKRYTQITAADVHAAHAKERRNPL